MDLGAKKEIENLAVKNNASKEVVIDALLCIARYSMDEEQISNFIQESKICN